MRKSIYLNAKKPLYTTRYNVGCIAFKAQAKQKEFEIQKNIEDSKEISKRASWRINLLQEAYTYLKNRMIINLLTTNESQCLQNY